MPFLLCWLSWLVKDRADPSCLFLIHASFLSGIHCYFLGLSPPFFPTWLQQGEELGENFRIKNTSLSFSLSSLPIPLLWTGAGCRDMSLAWPQSVSWVLWFCPLMTSMKGTFSSLLWLVLVVCVGTHACMCVCIHVYAHVCICGAVCGPCVLCVDAHESVCKCVCMHVEARSQGWVSSSIMFHLISWDRVSV